MAFFFAFETFVLGLRASAGISLALLARLLDDQFLSEESGFVQLLDG